MLIFAVDDEPNMLRLLHDAIETAAPDAEILDFSRGNAALDAIIRQGKRPDAVFSDIQMPGIDGLELAIRLKTASPDTKVVFVTGYANYAVDAYRLHTSGYVMKPVDPERVREELMHMDQTSVFAPDRIQVHCFGYFDVFYRNQPLKFTRSKTKELFAYLVDRRGAFCTAGEIINALWDDQNEGSDPKHYLRVLTGDLTAVLREIGMEQAVQRKRGLWAVDKTKLDCDYYRMLEGDMDAVNAYRGTYMLQYSWAEMTAASLQFQNPK